MIRQTSIEAYHKIKEDGTLSSSRWHVYEILYKHGPLTAGELKQKMLWSKENFLKVYKSESRLTELRDMGVVQELGKKKCSLSGMTVILWDVTDKLPVKLKRDVKPSKKKMLADAIEVINKYANQETEQGQGDLFGCGCDRGKLARKFKEDWGIE